MAPPRQPAGGPLVPTARTADTLWALVLEAARLDEVAEQAVVALEPSLLAKYTFALAQAFNAFYHRYPILDEEREDARFWRAAVAAYFRRQMTRALDIMGATVPVRMYACDATSHASRDATPVSPSRAPTGTTTTSSPSARAGGEPRLVDALDARPRAPRGDTAAGVLLTGGPDVDPRLYGEAPAATYEPAGRGRDAFELELVAARNRTGRAGPRHLPRRAGHERGAAGGTLVQHIPADVPQPLDHQVKTPAWAIAHDVAVVGATSLLARALALPATGVSHARLR